jgi:hypothetical protein
MHYPEVKIPCCGACCQGSFRFFWWSCIFINRAMKYAGISVSAVIAAELSPGKIPCANTAVQQLQIRKQCNSDHGNSLRPVKCLSAPKYIFTLAKTGTFQYV